jgi:hypothetical protein
VNAASALAALVLSLAPQGRAPHGPEPGPRRALAGIAGFQSVSRLDFGAQENRLTAVYVFPDRVRWHFESYAAVRRSEHEFFYRHGERVHRLSSGAHSRALEGPERDTVLAQMELRRAAMLWPDGFGWSIGADGHASALLQADSCCGELPLGTLVATLVEGRPARIEALDPEGRALETLEIRAWQDLGGRTWPRTLELRSEGGSLVETVEAVETRVHYLELSFLPPDRRPMPASRGATPGVLARDLVAMTYAPRRLPEEVNWEEAMDKAREWVAQAAKTLEPEGLTVDPVPTFELSPAGRPTTCLIRLSVPLLSPPEGFVTQPERAGLFLPLQRIDGLDSGAMERLLAALPEGAAAGTPYVRLHERAELPIELVLPLVPKE